MINKLKDKIINNNIHFEILIFLYFLFIPYFGHAGNSILMSFGEYYTIAYFVSIVICFLAFITNKNLSQSKNPFYVDRTYFWCFIVNGLFILLLSIISNLNFARFIGVGTFLLFPFILSARGNNDETLKAIGFMGFLMYLYEMISSIHPLNYFNINTYSFLIVFSALLSLLMLVNVKNKYIKLCYATIVLVAAAVVVKVKYQCDTQLIAAVGSYFLYLIKCLLTNKKISLSIYTFIYATVILMPIIVLIMMKLDFISGDIFTFRGFQWQKSYESIRNAGAFIVTDIDPMAHNGFFDLAIKITMEGAVIYMITFFILGFHIIKNLPKNDEGSLLLLIILFYYLIINITESFFMPINDWGFTALIFGLLLNKIQPVVTKRFLEVKRGRR